MLQENTFFSFEYMVHSQLAERPGLPVSINIEGNHLITPAAAWNTCIRRTRGFWRFASAGFRASS